jgi:hypothetical protein
MMDSIVDRTDSSLIAMLDWLLLAMVEAADPRSHRGDPLDFAVVVGQAPPLEYASTGSACPHTIAAMSGRTVRRVVTGTP